MTAAEQVYADPEYDAYRAAVDAYLTRNRHAEPTPSLSRNAQRAGLAAARSYWERHPVGQEDTSDLVLTSDRTHKDQLVAAGWTCLGASTQYVLAPPGWQSSTGPASPVDGGP